MYWVLPSVLLQLAVLVLVLLVVDPLVAVLTIAKLNSDIDHVTAEKNEVS
jgi:hypothetical protein